MTTKKKAKVKVRITKAKVRGVVPLAEDKHLVVADDVAFEVHGSLPPEVHPLPIPVEFEADLDKYNAGPAIAEKESSGMPWWGWALLGIAVLMVVVWVTYYPNG
jgi:hypothetical protein